MGQCLLLKLTISHANICWWRLNEQKLKLSGYNCKIEYLAGRENTCSDLLLRIPKQLEAESVRVEPGWGVNDRAYQIGVINSNRLGNHPELETDMEETTQIMTDHH